MGKHRVTWGLSRACEPPALGKGGRASGQHLGGALGKIGLAALPELPCGHLSSSLMGLVPPSGVRRAQATHLPVGP